MDTLTTDQSGFLITKENEVLDRTGAKGGLPADEGMVPALVQSSFCDMVMGQTVPRQQDNFISNIDVVLQEANVMYGHSKDVCDVREVTPVTGSLNNTRVELNVDERFGPWLQVTGRRQKLNVNHMCSNPFVPRVSQEGGSRFEDNVVRVVEDNDNPSRVLKEHNSRAMYGLIRFANSKGTKWVSIATKPLPQKDATSLATSSSGSKDTRLPIVTDNEVKWVENSSFEDSPLPNQ
ncbi:hypothetical protein V6N11_008040 [Hibiscus sabdariffa]|uniref:Uncharacterized protein n=1 Tax=Hibiscus sabdariffa TaxID=183260 RepID=A0ABR2Q037_9ROSI